MQVTVPTQNYKLKSAKIVWLTCCDSVTSAACQHSTLQGDFRVSELLIALSLHSRTNCLKGQKDQRRHKRKKQS